MTERPFFSDLLGLPLETALARLKQGGYEAEAVEARSLKGAAGADSKRVIRVEPVSGDSRPEEAGRVLIVYSLFKTTADEE